MQEGAPMIGMRMMIESTMLIEVTINSELAMVVDSTVIATLRIATAVE